MLLSGISAVVLLIPTWVFLLGYYLLDPTGFWQKIVFCGVGLFFLGAIQVVLAIILLFCLVKIWE